MISLAMPNLTGNEKKYLDNCIDTTFDFNTSPISFEFHSDAI